MAKKTIAVVGATGAQGGGLVRAILADPSGEFAARALTRDVNSEKAKALAKLGAEVVAVNVDDAASLRRAFAGRLRGLLRDLLLGALLAREGAGPGPGHGPGGEGRGREARRLVHPRGHAQVGAAHRRPHAHAAGQVQGAALRRQGRGERVLHRRRACRRPSSTPPSTGTTSSTSAWGRRRGPTASSAFVLPMGDKKLPGIAAEDIGRCAYGIFKRARTLVGKTVGIAGEHLTGAQMAAALAKALGQEVGTTRVTPEVYRGFGFPGADDLGNMFQFKARLREGLLRRARPRLLALAQPAAPDLRAVARRQQGADPARLSRSARARSPRTRPRPSGPAD